MQVEQVAVSALIPYAKNSRTHSDAQIAQIAASIREFGFTNPLLIDASNSIIAGHGRLLAARLLGMVDVPCIRLTHLTKSQQKALIIADNKLALNAGWDNDLLAIELGDLKLEGFDLDLTGFNSDELAALEALGNSMSEGLTDENAVPEAPTQPVTVLGDLWTLGNHRLLCGDSTSADTVEKLLGPVKPHLMVTDPPYGVDYDANWRNERVRADGSPGDGRAIGKVLNDNIADWREAWVLFPGEVAYVWHAGLRANSVFQSLTESGFDIRAQIIWAKQQFAIGRGHYHFQHEPCWYAVKKNATGHWSGDRKQTTLWKIDKPQKSETGHSTQKPVECMLRPIQNNSNPG